MNAKHTPGPWSARDIDDETSARQFWVSAESDGELIAAAEPIGSAIENTRLIAAAPDLLAALIRAESKIRTYTDSSKIECDLAAIRAAIARATGEQA